MHILFGFIEQFTYKREDFRPIRGLIYVGAAIYDYIGHVGFTNTVSTIL